uniref:Uncharacterized protein n=1 Tax=Anopheles dirus TaxID=7168 RepID=A0A182N795_9DIPT
MNKAKTKTKKPSKSLRNVLAQPFQFVWPRVPDGDIKQCIELLKSVEREHIVSGCNGIIKQLEKGEVLALFILDKFNPQIFAKFVIEMARKRNPSLQVLALPSFPKGCNKGSMFYAIPKTAESEQSAAVRALLKWMQSVALQNGFVRKKRKVARETARDQTMTSPKAKRPLDEPMTDAEVAKLYIFESTAGQTKRHARKDFTSDFISLADMNTTVFERKSQDEQNPPTDDNQSTERKPFDASYKPLTVNRVQGNPDRVAHKKHPSSFSDKKKKNKQAK